ncbi:MAG: MbnP family protein, partial [Bacteroidota bacterium]|nr:MbnP family protein [Bacteroidota bacterium]
MKLQRISMLVFLFCAQASASSQTEVVLQLNHKVHSQPFFLGQSYEIDSTYVRFDRMEYYMCDFVITHDGGQETALIDKYILVNADINESHSLGEWDI